MTRLPEIGPHSALRSLTMAPPWPASRRLDCKPISGNLGCVHLSEHPWGCSDRCTITPCSTRIIRCSVMADSPALTLTHFAARSPGATLILAHGAGQGIDSPFMRSFGERLAERELDVVQFEFDYMRAARASGKRKPPDREPKLTDCWRTVVEMVRKAPGERPLLIGGKSMGGRMASLVVVCSPTIPNPRAKK